jgi:AcrR family transcriptional regulator
MPKPAPNTRAERLRTLSQSRRESERSQLQNRILDAAAALFLEEGYEGVSMRQVAERIGYSATTIYRYYDSKDDLLFAIVHEGFRRFGDDLWKAARKAKDPLGQLKAVCAAYVKFGLQNPVYYQLMFMQRSDFLFHSRDEKAPMIASFGLLQSLVAEAMAAGILAPGDPETTSTVVWAVGHGITALAIADPKRFTAKRLRQSMDVAMQMMLHGLSRQ